MISALINLQRVLEDTCNIYRLENDSGPQARVHVHATRLSNNLEDCISALSMRLRNDGMDN